MATESSKLIGNKGSSNSQLQNNSSSAAAEELHDHPSFLHPKTGEQKLFVAFLVFMIVCLIALSIVVILDSSSGNNASREIRRDDSAANSRLDLLNSLYRQDSPLQSGCESTLLLLRHCEKTTDADGVVHRDGNNYCSWLGRERAYFFASLFVDPTTTSTTTTSSSNPRRRWPAPSKIFALTEDKNSHDSAKSNYREIEFVMPLANKFGLEIDVYNSLQKDGMEGLAADYFELLQSGDMCGKVTVVSWKHDLIPALAFALACGPAEGCPYTYPDESFDEVWQMKFVFDPRGAARTAPAPMDLPVATQGPLTLYHDDKPPSPRNLPDDDDDEDDDDKVISSADKKKDDSPPPPPPPPKRRLKEKKKTTTTTKHEHERIKKWSVYGTKTFQNFDPLQYSMLVGDYPPGGSPTGGKWADEM